MKMFTAPPKREGERRERDGREGGREFNKMDGERIFNRAYCDVNGVLVKIEGFG